MLFRSDWKQQKEEQARLRKLQNEIAKIEDEIATLEVRNEELDQLLMKEEICTNVAELVKINDEKKQVEERLEALFERWEELS